MSDLSLIFELKEQGGLNKVAGYTLPPKQALVAYIEQTIRNNFHMWNYPLMINGMREGTPNHWYFDDHAGKRVLAAYPA